MSDAREIDYDAALQNLVAVVSRDAVSVACGIMEHVFGSIDDACEGRLSRPVDLSGLASLFGQYRFHRALCELIATGFMVQNRETGSVRFEWEAVLDDSRWCDAGVSELKKQARRVRREFDAMWRSRRGVLH